MNKHDLNDLEKYLQKIIKYYTVTPSRFSPSRNETEIAILTNLYRDRFPKV